MTSESDQNQGEAPKGPPAVRLDNVGRYFERGGTRAIDGVSLAIDPGDFVAIVGASGSGKSTLLNLMGGIDFPDTGKVFIDDVLLQGTRAWTTVRARSVGFVFQSFYLQPTLSAVENVEIPLFGRLSGARARRERASFLLSRVGLQHRTEHMPSELSGGEKQRVAIARSLANAPAILLADEPTGNLDSKTAAHIISLFTTIHEQDGTTLILVTHEQEIAAQAGRIILLKDGRIASDSRGSACTSRP